MTSISRSRDETSSSFIYGRLVGTYSVPVKNLGLSPPYVKPTQLLKNRFFRVKIAHKMLLWPLWWPGVRTHTVRQGQPLFGSYILASSARITNVWGSHVIFVHVVTLENHDFDLFYVKKIDVKSDLWVVCHNHVGYGCQILQEPSSNPLWWNPIA